MTTLETKMAKSKRQGSRIRKTLRFVAVCVLTATVIITCSLYGLRDGLIGGFLLFMIFGGLDVLLWSVLTKD